MSVWRWLLRDRWAIWLYQDNDRTCVASTHRTWWQAHHAVHHLERISRWRYPPVWYSIERIERPIRHTEHCIGRD